jgi:type II secretory pathway component PulF
VNEWFARLSFRGERAEFWRDLATMTRAKVAVIDHIRAIAAREPRSARGRMMQLWLDALLVRPDFSEAVAPYVPLTDRVMLQAAATSEQRAEVFDLLAEQIELTKKLSGQLLGTLTMPLLGLASAVSLVVIYGAKVFPEFIKVYPLEFWPPSSQDIARVAMFLGSWNGVIVAAALVVFAIIVIVSLGRWTGQARAWFDEHVWPYTLVRDVRGIAFVMALATILRSRIGFREAIERIGAIGSPWLAWQAERIGANLRGRYAADPIGALATGIVGRRLYYRLVDYGKVPGLDVPDLLVKAARDEAATVQRRLAKLAGVLSIATLIFAAAAMGLTSFAIPQPDPTRLGAPR